MEGSTATGWKKRRLEEEDEQGGTPTSFGDCSPPEPDEQELNGLMEQVSQESLRESVLELIKDHPRLLSDLLSILRHKAEEERQKKEAFRQAMLSQQSQGAGPDIEISSSPPPPSQAATAMADTQFKLYVGNLPFSVSEEQLHPMFANFGAVVAVQIVREPGTERSRGFGFVKMGNEQATVDAIKGMNGMFVGGRCIRVRRSFIPAGTTSSSGGGPLSPSTSASGSAVASPASSPAIPTHPLPPHSYHPVSQIPQPQQPLPPQWSSPPLHSMRAGPAPATSSVSHSPLSSYSSENFPSNNDNNEGSQSYASPITTPSGSNHQQNDYTWQSAPPTPPQPTTATPQQHAPSNAIPGYRPRCPAATATTPPH